MSEASVQAKLQAAFLTLDEYQPGDVVIDDFSVRDQSIFRSPYIIIETADEFNAVQDTLTPTTEWRIPVTLIVRFTDWIESLENFRTYRQNIIDLMNSDGNRSGDGLNINRITPAAPITQYYPTYREEIGGDEDPVFIEQIMLFYCEEF